MKLTADRPYAYPERAARRLMQHAHAFKVVQDGRIYVEKINAPFLYVDKGTPDPYAAGLTSLIVLPRTSGPRVLSRTTDQPLTFLGRRDTTLRYNFPPDAGRSAT